MKVKIIGNTKQHFGISALDYLAGIFLMLTVCPSSAFADVRLKYADGNQGLLWRDGYNIVYKLCSAATSANRDCVATIGPLQMSQIDYEPAVRRKFDLEDTPYSSQNSMARLQSDIADIESALKDPGLSPIERSLAQAKLMLLKRYELSLMIVNGVLSHLDGGNDVTYDQAFNENFVKIVAPFKEGGNVVPEVPDDLVQISSIGLVAKKIDDMCWYDAAGRRRPSVCHQPTIKKGCALSLGRQWRLPVAQEIPPLEVGFNASGSEWLEPVYNYLSRGEAWIIVQSQEGPLVRYKENDWRPNPEWNWNRAGTSSIRKKWLESRLTLSIPTICVARAKDVDPSGDVDGDGVPNSEDVCSRQHDDLTSPVAMDGPFIGCAAGQVPDEPIGGNIPSGGSNAIMSQYVTARLVLQGDGRFVMWVNVKQSLSSVSIVMGDALYRMTQDGGRFWTVAAPEWRNKKTVTLRVVLMSGQTITGEIELAR